MPEGSSFAQQLKNKIKGYVPVALGAGFVLADLLFPEGGIHIYEDLSVRNAVHELVERYECYTHEKCNIGDALEDASFSSLPPDMMELLQDNWRNVSFVSSLKLDLNGNWISTHIVSEGEDEGNTLEPEDRILIPQLYDNKYNEGAEVAFKEVSLTLSYNEAFSDFSAIQGNFKNLEIRNIEYTYRVDWNNNPSEVFTISLYNKSTESALTKEFWRNDPGFDDLKKALIVVR